MANVEKITVSISVDLLSKVEMLRERVGGTRSAAMAELMWRGWQAQENEARAERYAKAYTAVPETDQEADWLEQSADAFVEDSDPWIRGSEPTRAAG